MSGWWSKSDFSASMRSTTMSWSPASTTVMPVSGQFPRRATSEFVAAVTEAIEYL
jgi:hypothetical protein